uniref:Retrotransposon protein, putative, Ty1-copia subclass n=1 Tax=Tanacetum cinerariifolium TaxID=118510 RepID=A0A6L2KQP4_TANCI|nr:retrotransposon protein, putative, Ty1-copia subclass [Tanacetum cinerariifolium]
MEWYRNLWIVLSAKDKLPFLEQLIPTLPVPPAGQANPSDVVTTHQAWVKGHKEINRLMLMTMDPDIQKNLEHLGAYNMLKELKTFLILVSLKKEYDGFVQNYNMHSMGKTAAKGNQRKGKAKIGNALVPVPSYAPKPKNPPTPKKDNPVKDAICHQCGEVCHWRRNYPIYLAKLIKKKLSQGASTSGIFTMELYSFPSTSWVYDTVFQKEVENQRGKTIKSLHSDRRGEYMSQEFLDHLKDHGIITHRTPPYTPQHNGVLERRNRTLLDMVRSMMSQTTLPKSFWDYAIESTTCILNMVPTNKVDKTPYNVWHGQAPKLSYLKVWGYEALVKCDTLTKPDKLEPKAFKCIFVGYSKEMMGYSFYYLPENKVFVTQNAEFFENDVKDHEASGCLEDLEIIQEEDTHPSLDTSLNHEEDDQEIDEPQSDINLIRRSIRTQRAPDRLCLYIDAEEHELGDLDEPANYKAALLDPKSNKWLNAMNVEMQSMKHNEVWELLDLPPNKKSVGQKWLFKKKTNMDGAVHTYKARLVAKGFTQTLRIDYEETFSRIVDIRAIRILIPIATFYDYEIWQIDVKTTFLNVYLNEENPCDAHWTTVKNILKYLRNTKDMFLVYGGVVDWKSTKQSIFATSSIYTKYIAAFYASKEAVWIRKFIYGLGVVPTIEEPINMYCDNTGAIAITKDHRVTKGARHFRTKFTIFEKP